MIDLAKLAKRDKWTCHLCEQRVDRLFDATRDHLIPKSFGGTNNDDNIALAHKWCNREKADKHFRAEQNGRGWVVVDPNGEVISDEYANHIDAHTVAQAMNRDKLYMDPYYSTGKTSNPSDDDIVVIRRVQDHPM